MSLNQCVMNAQPYIAQWINEHPKWVAMRWRCDYELPPLWHWLYFLPVVRQSVSSRPPARKNNSATSRRSSTAS
jgi:hypothetical protein